MEEYILIKREQERAEDIRRAKLMFKHATLISRLFNGGQREIDFMAEYDWLFTAEERKQAKHIRLMKIMEGR